MIKKYCYVYKRYAIIIYLAVHMRLTLFRFMLQPERKRRRSVSSLVSVLVGYLFILNLCLSGMLSIVLFCFHVVFF